ncbi:MAG: helix-turn-helix domain-containing protein [Eubacteriales bacterium]|nr:helix-turn-helix domain-containing protein [Eubacteriales bacterium]
MNGSYTLNELAMMTGFTTRTLRTYLNQGLLTGGKENGVWRFSAEDLDRFFREPFVKEGLRIKRNSAVFDFLSDRSKKGNRACVILDLPVSMKKANEISAFFCDRMKEAADAVFYFGWDNGLARVILCGAEEQIARITEAYRAAEFTD